jgi:hypothetical protein
MQEVEHGVNVPDSAVEIAEVMRRREMQARFCFRSFGSHDAGKFLPSHRSPGIKSRVVVVVCFGIHGIIDARGSL